MIFFKTNSSQLLVFSLLSSLLVFSCSKGIHYSAEHIAQTSGRYLYNQDEIIDVYYDDNTLFLKWKGADKIKPVALDANTFFVADMYKKLRFVQNPKTQQRYLGTVSETNDSVVTYDYLKVADTFETPSMYLKDKDYDKALAGYLEIQKQDSTSVFIEERAFNSLGYKLLRAKEFDDAIAVFKINVALYPESDNVYDSLGEAYLKKGDSLNAFDNYKKSLQLNTGNRRAKEFVDYYAKTHN
ncbi:MAG: tetratricopeptide repeat protein [Gelidibacter sp.]